MTGDRPDASESLMLAAWQFAAGELSEGRAAAFRSRLGHDFAAQAALAEAIRRSAAALGQTPPTPDPLRRAAIRDELRGRLLARRPYRGHPLAWAGLGGAASVLLTGLCLRMAEGRPEPASPAVAGGPAAAERSVRVTLPGDVPPAVGGLAIGGPLPPAKRGGE